MNRSNDPTQSNGDDLSFKPNVPVQMPCDIKAVVTPAVLNYANPDSQKSRSRELRRFISLQIFLAILTLPVVPLIAYGFAELYRPFYLTFDPAIGGYYPFTNTMWWGAYWVALASGFIIPVAAAIKFKWRAYTPALLIAIGCFVLCPAALLHVMCGFHL